MSKTITILASILFLTSSSFAAVGSGYSTDATNTKKNERDAQGQTLTPENQAKGSTADVELTRMIRQELVKNEGLSTNAQNVKIITLNGVVTLRGPVESANEKTKIEEIAKKTAGVKRVDSQIEVQTK